jgi:hypothetical protein
MRNVTLSFNHAGFETNLTPEKYQEEIQLLTAAKFKYPELPLNEAYIAYKKNPTGIILESRGLGDTIYKITHATGLNKLAEMYTKVTGQPCGCSNRQEALNKLVPYGIKENGV